MVSIHRRASWSLPERMATPESTFVNRRQVLAAMGLGIAGTALAGVPTRALAQSALEAQLKALPKLDGPRNGAYMIEQQPTPEIIAAQYNNFYEFSTGKEDVWMLTDKFQTRPWTIEMTGMAHKTQTVDMDELMKTMPLEERVYRFRCVEAWSMVVPWTGFPLKKLIERAQPMASAKYVKFSTFMRPEQAPRQGRGFFFKEPWPYTEGLTMAEATNELALVTVGSYGHTLPKQHGAPVRLILPWKYGFKSIKSIDRIEFTDKRPETFWNTIAPNEYGFFSNVNPRVPHPRWSQAFERDIGTRRRKPTLLYNGYEEQVAHLYKDLREA